MDRENSLNMGHSNYLFRCLEQLNISSQYDLVHDQSVLDRSVQKYRLNPFQGCQVCAQFVHLLWHSAETITNLKFVQNESADQGINSALVNKLYFLYYRTLFIIFLLHHEHMQLLNWISIHLGTVSHNDTDLRYTL